MSIAAALLKRLPEKTQRRIAESIYERSMPKVGKEARTFVAHGDNRWGNAVSTRGSQQLSGRFGIQTGSLLNVSGHISRRPTNGDQLLVKMQSGKWAVFVLTEVELCRDPHDMFFADARGPIRYASPEETPQTDNASEFLGKRSQPLATMATEPAPTALDQLAAGVASTHSYSEGELVFLDGESAKVTRHVFDGLILEQDGSEVIVDAREIARVQHIPEPASVEPGPSSRISSLAD